MKRTVDSLGDLSGKKVLMRVDFNVPLDGDTVTDDTRIRAALDTIKLLLEKNAALVLCSHLSRPQTSPIAKWPKQSLAPAQKRLAELLGREVLFAYNCVGKDTAKQIGALTDGQILLLENTRFHSGEEWNSPDFAKALAKGCDLFVNDAFGAAHRAHGSTVGVTEYLSPCVMGKLVARELEVLDEVLNNPTRPLVVILGGAKVADKIGVCDNLISLADKMIIGGGMAYTFLAAQGKEVGKSLLDKASIPAVQKVMEQAKAKGVELLLPEDVVVSSEDFGDIMANHALADSAYTVDVDSIPADCEGMDIGPKTRKKFIAALQDAGMVFWNGPMGVFEVDKLAAGTNALAEALSDTQAKVIIGGGDSGAAVAKAGVQDKMYHNCTGGGASLEFLEGLTLPGIAAVDEA